MTRRERRSWAVFAALALVVCLHAWKFKPLEDFRVFYNAGGRFLSGAQLYVLADGQQCFKYAPIVAVFFEPFAPFWFEDAALAWMLLSATAFAWLWNWIWRRYAPEAGLVWHLIAFLWVIPFLRQLTALGQCDLFVLAALALSESLAKKRPWLSGALWAVACLFKLPFLILVPLALLFREWKRLAALAIGIVIGVVLPVFRYGSEAFTLISDWRALLAETTPPMICGFDNQSLYGIVCRYVAAPLTGVVFYGIVWVLALAILGVSARFIWRRAKTGPDDARAIGFALSIYLAAFLSPLGWRSNLVALLPLFYVVAARWSTWSKPVRALVATLASANTFIGLLAYDLLGRDAFHALIEAKAIGLLAAVFVAVVVSGERFRNSGSISPRSREEPNDQEPKTNDVVALTER